MDYSKKIKITTKSKIIKSDPCRRSARISAAKENNTNYDVLYSLKCVQKRKRTRKTKRKFESCDCQRKFSMHSRKNSPFSNLNTNNNNNTPSNTERLVEDALNFNQAQGPFDKNSTVDKKNDTDDIFKCVKMKSESKTNDLKMKIKKCHKKLKKKEDKPEKSDDIDNSDKVSKDKFNGKSRAQKVFNKILKRKRQTCRTQFRHKDITLYKLGTGNTKEPAQKQEVIQKIYQRRSSNSPQKQSTANDSDDSGVPEINKEKTATDPSVNNSDTIGNGTSVKVDSNEESPQRNIHSALIHLQNNVSNSQVEIPQFQITQHGPSSYSIESLTGQTTGKHILPIRIPERRSSIAEPLRTPPAYSKLQNGQNSTFFNFLTSELQSTVTSPKFQGSAKVDTNPLSVNNMIQLDTLPDRKQSKEVSKNINGKQNGAFSSEPKVSTATTTYNLPTPSLHVPLDVKSLNNVLYADKQLKRKHVYTEEADKIKQFKANNCLITSVQNLVPSLPSTYNYPPNNKHPQLFSYNKTPVHTQSALPTYIPYNHKPILHPNYNYNYQNSPLFNKFIGGLVPSKLNLENSIAKNPKVSPKQNVAEAKSPVVLKPKLVLHSSELFKIDPAASKTYKTEPSKLNFLKKEDDSVKKENVNAVYSTKNENEKSVLVPTKKEETDKKETRRCSSPLVISDSDTDHETHEETALNLTKSKDKAELPIHNKLTNTTQSHVMQTLNTLTYVVNEIIDKSGDNMPKQKKELLHKLLEGVRQNSTINTDKHSEIVIKQESCIELISSDSELSNDAITTDSNGTLDLSMKKTPDLIKPVTTVKESAKNDSLSDKEPSILNLSKEHRLCEENGIINLSIHDRKEQMHSVSKEKLPIQSPTVSYNKPPVRIVSPVKFNKLSVPISSPVRVNYNKTTSAVPVLSPIKLNKELPAALVGYNAELQQNFVPSKNPDYAKPRPPSSSFNTNYWTQQVPVRRSSVSVTNKPAEITQRRSTLDSTLHQLQNNLYHSSSSTPVEHSNVIQPNNVWPKKPKPSYVNTHYNTGPGSYYQKSLQMHPQKMDDYNSAGNFMYPQFPNYSAFNAPNNQSDVLKNGRTWEQYNTAAKNHVDKSIRELLRNKQKKQNYSAPTIYKQISPTQTRLPELPSVYRTQHNLHHCLRPNYPSSDVPSKKPQPTYQDPKINPLLVKEKLVNDFMVHPGPEMSFSQNKKPSNSDTQLFNNNVSPDYGYFSPLSKFAPVTDDVTKLHSGFSKNLESLSITESGPKSAEKSNCTSPILHPKDQEKLLKILPKLHSDSTLSPEQYVMEVHILEKDGCPRPFLDFYSYITRKQISSNQRPVCFRIFLEFQNAGKLKQFERAFKIYSEKHEHEKHVIKDN